MKKTVCVILIFSIFFGLSACRTQQTTQSAGRVVTDITITCQNGPMQSNRHYTSTTKMRAILNYLRWIDPYGTPTEDPETMEGSLFQIVMRFSDGSEKVYKQKADRYMQIGSSDWLRIDPQKAMTLSQMVGQMASDKI